MSRWSSSLAVEEELKGSEIDLELLERQKPLQFNQQQSNRQTALQARSNDPIKIQGSLTISF